MMQTEPPVNILLVDDHVENLLALEGVLASLGQNLVRVCSGKEALKCLLEQDFALILLDIQMPEMDGFETATLIRSRARSRHIPIIFMTALHNSDQLVYKGYSVGAVDYLFKPIEPEILLSKVAAFVELFQKTAQIQRQADQLEAVNAELRTSQARLQNFLDHANDLIHIMSPSGELLYVNPAWKHTLGYDEADLNNLAIDIVHPQSRGRWLEAIYWVQAKPATRSLEITFLGKEGREVIVEGTLSSRFEADQLKAIHCIFHDITQRKQAERSLRQYTAQLHQVLDFNDMLKRITDKLRDSLDEGQILATVVQELALVLGVNRCQAALYDLTQQTATIAYEYTASMFSEQGSVIEMAYFPEYEQLQEGQSLQLCNLIPHPIQGRVAMLACAIVDDQGVLGDLRLVNDKDYPFRDLELHLVQQVANQCAIAIRQARLYQAAQAQVAALERLNGLKDDFLSTISHELRTPISNIKMATQMLKMTLEPLEIPPSADLERYFQILQSECEQEISLINDLLDLSRLDADAEPLLLTSIKLSTWVPHVAETFMERAHTQQQQIQVDLPDDLPALTTDLIDLERVLSELLGNACKYTPPGEQIKISAEATPERLQLHISNSGVEIPVEECDRIFDKFYRIPNNDPWKYSGTGLGLALVKKRVERLGATIHVASEAAQTRFSIEFPLPTS
ncbi:MULTISPECIES: ATP-binding protein [Trichocoleus]|uniref:histidine kinase n=1 Tax=Trichocoleus desertorum GB2-A4 TaxID=2933944 RepID=A0ABV0JDT1_9CYAN|nr:ATP-binding protein [Trichocoleus sp. FACHB-46]MBD1861342.1 response regulator [Trichocoleus sp. FACHB-46]